MLTNDMAELASFATGDAAKDSIERKCKIVCTMGPRCWDVPTLVQLIDEGMNVARLNFSHGDHKAHGQTVSNIREAAKQRPDKYVAILLDTKGPEIRTGFLKDKGGVELKKGESIILSIKEDYDTYEGDASKICVTYKALTTSVKPGNVILCADGVINLRVEEVLEGEGVRCVCLNNAKLGERKNVNLPGVHVDLPVLQEKDKEDLLKFGIPQGVDFVAASFVQTAQDVKDIRATLGLRGRTIKIISKIENEEGLKNFDQILGETDGVMVARGDLGMEIPPEKVFIAQKMMIAKCNLAGKPVVTATQMMESCIKNPRPTRAEASDVANAVLDGTDCVMLSGETANGDFPSETVHTMRRVCEEAEMVIDYGSLFLHQRLSTLKNLKVMPTVEAVCSSAVKAALDMGAPLILALTETGQTARLLAKYRPPQVIFAVTASETTARQLQLVRGVQVMLTASFQGTDSVIRKALFKAKEMKMIFENDQVVAVHGQKEECAGQTNLLKVITVP